MVGEGTERGPRPEIKDEIKAVWYMGDGRNILSDGSIVDDPERRAEFTKEREEDKAWEAHNEAENRNGEAGFEGRHERFGGNYPEGSEVDVKGMVKIHNKTFEELVGALKELKKIDLRRRELFKLKDDKKAEEEEVELFDKEIDLQREFSIDHNTLDMGDEAMEILSGDSKGEVIYSDWGESRPGDSSHTTIYVKYGDKILLYKNDNPEFGGGAHTEVVSLGDFVKRKKEIEASW